MVHSFFFLIVIYLAALGLSCCIWDLLLQHSNSLVVACSLSSSTSCGILVLWPEIKPCSLYWQVRFLTTDYQGSPQGSTVFFFFFFLAVLAFGCFACGFLWVGSTLPSSARASHCGDFSCCRAWALGTRAPVAAPHRLSSCGSWG